MYHQTLQVALGARVFHERAVLLCEEPWHGGLLCGMHLCVYYESSAMLTLLISQKEDERPDREAAPTL